MTIEHPMCPPSSRRGFLAIAAGGASAALATVPAAAAASVPDPVFPALSAYNRARAAREEMLEVLLSAERELGAAGDLHPYVISVGNPSSGLPPVHSTTHEEIDRYTPADMFPERNREEHATLAAAIERRDAMINPLIDVVSAAEDVENAALDDVHKVVPTTHAGALAVLETYRDWMSV
jgi:hypothetical protein